MQLFVPLINQVRPRIFFIFPTQSQPDHKNSSLSAKYWLVPSIGTKILDCSLSCHPLIIPLKSKLWAGDKFSLSGSCSGIYTWCEHHSQVASTHHLNANTAERWGSVYQAPHLHGAAGSAHFAELIPELAVRQGESGSKLAVEAQSKVITKADNSDEIWPHWYLESMQCNLYFLDF